MTEEKRLTLEQAAAAKYVVCQVHAQFFPKEDPRRPLTEWSYNLRTLTPLRSRCKRCDGKTKDYYAQRKKATRGPIAIEQIRKNIELSEADIAKWDQAGHTEWADSERVVLAWLEASLAELLKEAEEPNA